MANTKLPRLQVRKIYLKDASFESPASPDIFAESAVKPNIELSINGNHYQMDADGNFFEVTLQATVTATKEEKTIFIAEIHQAGIFEIHPDDDEHRNLLLRIACPNMLLPFAREEIASLVTKGGFPPVLLSPINFETIYRPERETVAEQESQTIQ